MGSSAATQDTACSGTGRGKTQENAALQNGGEEEDGVGGRQAVTGPRKKGTVL